VASNYSGEFLSPDFGADGIFGLGFQQASAYNGNSVFQTLIDKGVLKNSGLEPVFSFALIDSLAIPVLVIGGSESSLFSGNLSLVDVEGNKVTTLRGVSCLRLTRTRCRAFGRPRWIPYLLTEVLQLVLGMQFSTQALPSSLVTKTLSLRSIAISPVRPRFQAANGQVRISRG
jgi:aspartyl protease